MTRRVFFSFDYDRDIWRVSQVRNSWVIPGIEEAGFIDAVTWESVKKKDEQTIRNWIDSNLKSTSVTIVLIGADTSNSKYVKYEIEQSISSKVNNGILGIRIHKIKDTNGRTDSSGRNPFEMITSTQFKNIPVYDWIDDNGRDNIGNWVEKAAKLVGR